ncbi:MAG: AI-2E family transporter [Acidobacteriota bacterium]
MNSEYKSRFLFAAGVSTAAIACLAIAWHARFLLLLLFAGFIFALFLKTAMSGLQRLLKVRYGVAYGLVLAAGAALLILFLWLRGPALLEQANELRSLLPAAARRMVVDAEQTQWGAWIAEQVSDQAQISRAVSLVLSGIGGATIAGFSFVGGMLIVLLVGLYVSVEPDYYRRAARGMIPAAHRETFDLCLAGAVRNLRFWLLARALSMAIVGCLVGVGLWIVGTPLAGTLGLITGLLTFIPNLGPVLSAVPAVLLAFTISPFKALLALGVICAAHFLEGNFLTPLMDRGIVKLPPALTLTAQCLLGSVTGLVGIALAAPVLAVVLGAADHLGSPPEAVVPLPRPVPDATETTWAISKRVEVKRFPRKTPV